MSNTTTTTRSDAKLSRQEVEMLLAEVRSSIKMSSSHVYTTPLGKVPSVTTIIKNLDKPALLWWASKMQSEACEAEVVSWLQEKPEDRGDIVSRLQRVRQAHRDYSRSAADMGKEGHALAEYEFKKRLGLDALEPALKHPREAHMVKAGIMEWADAHKFEPVALEQPLYHATVGYAGTADWIAYVDGALTIGDWKSNDKCRIFRESYLQNIGLRAAAKSVGLECAGLVVVVPRDGQGDPNPVPIPWRDADYKAFLGLLDVHRWAKMIG